MKEGGIPPLYWKIEGSWVTRARPATVAILGGNTVAGLALSLLLRSVGYHTALLKAPPAGSAEDLLGDVDLLLVAPGLGEERPAESLAALGGAEERLGIPVLAFTSDVEEGLFDEETAGVPWPVEIRGLARAIEAALVGEPEIGPAIVTNTVGGEAALS